MIDSPLMLLLLLIAGAFALILIPLVLAVLVEALPIIVGIVAALWLYNAIF